MIDEKLDGSILGYNSGGAKTEDLELSADVLTVCSVDIVQTNACVVKSGSCPSFGNIRLFKVLMAFNERSGMADI